MIVEGLDQGQISARRDQDITPVSDHPGLGFEPVTDRDPGVGRRFGCRGHVAGIAMKITSHIDTSCDHIIATHSQKQEADISRPDARHVEGLVKRIYACTQTTPRSDIAHE